MHVATDVQKHMFKISVAGVPHSSEDFLPDWSIRDRLGIVVREPWGSLGASLLMQLGALLHYQARPSRRSTAAQYPQIYVFHIDTMHGDHSSFDVWPPRREILVEDDPAALLAAVNDRAITRLALPDRSPHSTNFLQSALTGWSDESFLRENLASAWLYNSDGNVESYDIRVESSAVELERMSVWALEPEATYAHYSPFSEAQLVKEMQIGPSTEYDLQHWLKSLKSRINETPLDVRAAISERRASTNGTRVQTYRRLSTDEALQRL
jgi:hypothetical protein